jgi:hypothetical protein
VRPSRGKVLHGHIVVRSIGAKQEDGTGLRMLESPIGVCAGFRELEVEKKPTKLSKVD